MSMDSSLPAFNREYGLISQVSYDLILREKSYWDGRFAAEDAFDWFHPYEAFRKEIQEHVSRERRILMIGCGNSKLSHDMHHDGFKVSRVSQARQSFRSIFFALVPSIFDVELTSHSANRKHRLFRGCHRQGSKLDIFLTTSR